MLAPRLRLAVSDAQFAGDAFVSGDAVVEAFAVFAGGFLAGEALAGERAGAMSAGAGVRWGLGNDMAAGCLRAAGEAVAAAAAAASAGGSLSTNLCEKTHPS